MKIQERLNAIDRHIKKHRGQERRFYPFEILDLIVFHKIHFYVDEKAALASFRRLKNNFVDWNEVRISAIPEIQEALGQSPHSLTLAVFIKDFLDFLHHEKQCVDLEFLAEENLSEIRRFLRRIKGIDPSTINMVLRLRKEYPMLPVDPRMEPTLLRLGVVRSKDNRDQMGRYLHNLVDPESALPFHHFFLNHSRDICPPDEDQIQCMRCGIRSSCHFYSKSNSKSRTSAGGSRRGAR